MQTAHEEVFGEEILGNLAQIIGDTGGGIDTSFLINAASELAQHGAQEYKSSEQKKASAADIEAKSSAVIAADAQATNACAQASYAAMVAKDSAALAAVNPALSSKAQADQAALAAAQAACAQAISAEDVASAGLPPEAAAKRVKAANDAAQKAVSASLSAAQAAAAAPNDQGKKAAAQLAAARAQAAQATATKAAAGQIAGLPPGSAPLPPHGKPSFFTKMVGPLPVYGWGLVGVGGAGILYGLVRLFSRKK